MVSFAVANEDEGEAALGYFNWFHDGFIKTLTLTSGDHFPEWGVQVTSGELQLEILFAHYNYGEGRPGPDQRVRTVFWGVKSLEMGLSGLAHEWTVDGLQIKKSTRRNDFGEREDCLAGELWQHVLSDKREWQRAKVFSWTFAVAKFVEE